MDVIINRIGANAPPDSKALTSQGDAYSNLLACLGYDKPPTAALLGGFHQLLGEWLVAVPIHWQATHNDAMIMAAGYELQLTTEESHAWFCALSNFLADVGFGMHYHDANTWLLGVDGKPTITSQSPYLMRHQSLMPAFASMDNTHYWQGLLTEIQMFLSVHPLNQSRPDLPINGIWLFGAGAMSSSDKALMTNNKQLCHYFPTMAKPLDIAALKYDKTIIFIDETDAIDVNQLHQQLSNHTVQWFWNDLAYSTAKKSWLTRLWRSMHANYTKGMR